MIQNKYGNTALILASGLVEHSLEVVKELIDAGADPNMTK